MRPRSSAAADWWTEAAARSTPLWHRLSQGFRATDSADVDVLWTKWARTVADGDVAALRRRPGRNAPDRIRPLLGKVEPPSSWALPPWVETAELLADAAAASEGAVDTGLSGAELPFADLILPIVDVGRRRLLEVASSTGIALPGSALRSLEEGLARTLLPLTGQALQMQFSIFRATHTSPLSRAALHLAPAPPRALYERFVSQLKQDRFRVLFDTYPVLARLAASAVDRWVVCSAELLQRLARDRARIVETVLRSQDPGGIRTISGGWSDPHNGGRTVHVVTFEDGSRIVYKPRELAIDIAFGEFVAWLGSRTIDLRSPRTLDCGRYGWTQFIEHEPCRSKAELSSYYRRAGILLAAVFALEGTDLHYENVIACGEYPVLVDVEMLFQPVAARPRSPASAVEELVARQLADTVFRTGLLPRWELQPDGACVDVSGLGSVENQSGGTTVRWEEPNTDRMRSVVLAAEIRRGVNVPFAADGDPAAFVDCILDGFRESYSAIADGRGELLGRRGVLSQFRDCPVRFLFRSTRGYASLLQYSVRPEFLTSGTERSILLDRLSRVVIAGDGALDARILDAELQAVEEFDIPRFSATTTSHDLRCAGESIPAVLSDSGWATVERRLRLMSVADLDRQCGFIAASFATRRETQRHAETPAGTHREPPEDVGPTALLQCAGEIAGRLIRSAVRSSADTPTWISISYSSEARRYELVPAGSSFYDGDGGIAVFLAAWARHADDARAHEFARAVGSTIAARVDTAFDDTELSRIGLGVGVGWGSVVYSVLRLGLLLDDPSLIRQAEHIAMAQITTSRIDESVDHDVLLGTAGALLALLAVHDATGSCAVLARAAACADRLLVGAHRDATGAAWLGNDGSRHPGFAHGAAGMALAVDRYARASGDDRFATLAREALRFARTAVRRDDDGGGWCRGAPGVALASLAMSADGDLDALLEATLTEASAVDHVCCGAAGRAAVLVEAGARLGRSDLAAAGRSLLGQVAVGSQPPRLATETRGFDWNPAFFQGLAGIGYEMLRATDPASLPCVLLFG